MFVLNFFLYSRTIRVLLIARMKILIQDIKYLMLLFIHICVLSIAQCSVYNRYSSIEFNEKIYEIKQFIYEFIAYKTL